MKKKEIIGFTYVGWELKMGLGNAKVPLIFPDNKVYHDMQYKKPVKVKITIEEIQ